MVKKQTSQKTNKLLAKLGYPMTPRARKSLGKFKNPLEPLLSEQEQLILKSVVSNTIPPGPCVSNDLLNDHKWKAGREESPEAVKAAQDKAKRIAPAYNKGPLTYMTDSALTLGQIDKAGKI
jgi:hypothetical protein